MSDIKIGIQGAIQCEATCVDRLWCRVFGHLHPKRLTRAWCWRCGKDTPEAAEASARSKEGA